MTAAATSARSSVTTTPFARWLPQLLKDRIGEDFCDLDLSFTF
jgi:hypothetical protein